MYDINKSLVQDYDRILFINVRTNTETIIKHMKNKTFDHSFIPQIFIEHMLRS